MAWQQATTDGRRSLVETAIGRYQGPIGPKLRARTFRNQRGEAAIAVEVLNPDLDPAWAFYRSLGLIPIVDARPTYARFRCPDGDSTFSLHQGAAAQEPYDRVTPFAPAAAGRSRRPAFADDRLKVES